MTKPLRVLKVSHSSVVSAWRERERVLNRRGFDVVLLTSSAWSEGGALVQFDQGADKFANGVRTWGTHPNLFVFDPRPIWRHLADPWDVIDIHEEPCSLATAEVLLLRALRARRTPFLLYSAQNIFRRYPPPFRWIEAWSLRRASGVSVCNKAAGDIVRRKGLRVRAELIPLGVDVATYEPEDRLAPDGELRIGYVGRLAEQKGVSVLLEALAPEVGWTVELVGAGPAAADLERQARALGVTDRVSFTGTIGQDQLPALYRSFDVVVVPSLPTRTWEEQFCRVAVEAMASGVPVVASRSGALPEVIDDAGLLAEPGDATELRAALQRLEREPGLWASLRRAGLERITRFTWEAVGNDYAELYRSAVS
jgi:glycosyltransferase involved in cell wall biosynthesis